MSGRIKLNEAQLRALLRQPAKESTRELLRRIHRARSLTLADYVRVEEALTSFSSGPAAMVAAEPPDVPPEKQGLVGTANAALVRELKSVRQALRRSHMSGGIAPSVGGGKWIALTLMATALTFLIAGCASKPPPPYQPPVTQVAPLAPVLTNEQMDKLCQTAPDACQRVRMGQPLTLGDVKAMAKIGFSSDVIIAQVRNSRTVYHLTANAILDLKKSGVSEQVIDFLINTPSSIAGSVPVSEPQTNPYPAQTPPPAPPVEVPSPAPGPDYVWVDGDWVWNGGWIWDGGHWAFPPFPHAGWHHGIWSRYRDGFHHGQGHWR